MQVVVIRDIMPGEEVILVPLTLRLYSSHPFLRFSLLTLILRFLAFSDNGYLKRPIILIANVNFARVRPQSTHGSP